MAKFSTEITVNCPYCASERVVKNGKGRTDKVQRYLYRGWVPSRRGWCNRFRPLAAGQAMGQAGKPCQRFPLRTTEPRK